MTGKKYTHGFDIFSYRARLDNAAKFGLGTIALSGVFIYLIGGFVNWSDLNRNTHWGVIILWFYNFFGD